MWYPTEEVERFMQNDLTEEERELICWRNAERFLGEQAVV
jgi:predicted TIM-barrel fold metal-dependent hydrolase